MDDILIFKDDDKSFVFYRKKYYEFICFLIKNFFQVPLSQNKTHKWFVDTLNSLQDYDDVYFINSELPFYWAMNIIQNDRTTETLLGEDLDRYIEFAKNYDKENGITSYIVEYDDDVDLENTN